MNLLPSEDICPPAVCRLGSRGKPDRFACVCRAVQEKGGSETKKGPRDDILHAYDTMYEVLRNVT